MKKHIIIPLVIIVILLILSFAANYIDGARVRAGVEPKLTVRIVSNGGNTVTYWGLGYKVVRYPAVSPNEPFKNSLGVKMGNWFMDYTLPEEEPIEIELLIENKKLKVTERNDIEFISALLKDSKYMDKVCKGVKTHKVNLNGEQYYIKSYCKGIQRQNTEAQITFDDLVEFQEIVAKYK